MVRPGLFARWIEQLSDFTYTVEHRPGKSHGNADGLSRLPECVPEVTVATTTVTDTLCPDAESSSWVPTWSPEAIRAAQEQDKDISLMIGWQEALLDRPRRSDPCMVGASRQLLRLWSQWKRLRLIQGVLHVP